MEIHEYRHKSTTITKNPISQKSKNLGKSGKIMSFFRFAKLWWTYENPKFWSTISHFRNCICIDSLFHSLQEGPQRTSGNSGTKKKQNRFNRLDEPWWSPVYFSVKLDIWNLSPEKYRSDSVFSSRRSIRRKLSPRAKNGEHNFCQSFDIRWWDPKFWWFCWKIGFKSSPNSLKTLSGT